MSKTTNKYSAEVRARAVRMVLDTGRIAIVTDPTGAMLGLMTPVEMPDG
jgi:predicted enzyme related to lactoylglutathione lyase